MPGAVDGFVLWTRNLRPLLSALDVVRLVAPFTVQFTVTTAWATVLIGTSGPTNFFLHKSSPYNP